MIDLKTVTLQDKMPDSLLQDPVVFNLAKTISEKLNDFSVVAYKLNYSENLHDLPESVIDHLLWEAHVFQDDEGLLLADTLEEKTQLLESSIELHRYKGTPFAVERALEAVNMPGEVTEWFQEKSEPYHFAVELQVNEKINRVESARRLVLHYKNKRSWFDGFVLVLQNGDFLITDDSYDYPVYYKTCGEFSGEKEFTHADLGAVRLIDDSYDYQVEYPVYEQPFEQANLPPVHMTNGSYGYQVPYPTTGEMQTMSKGFTQLEGRAVTQFDQYNYPAPYPVCGEFYAEGESK
ncbi:phage tail protein [Sporosarcina sp. P33]|uniref:phage tail protein n=1 Tax=Sporosarcina sp. P33 TaxID=1930764 RepID=UPI0009BD4D90|nr:phage tail protein [Sporosarcina sp. P33]ARD47565.1 hypothetical protein SporoP33_04480 [Sporosarcina sp. P33]